MYHKSMRDEGLGRETKNAGETELEEHGEARHEPNWMKETPANIGAVSHIVLTENEDECYYREYGPGGFVRDRQCGEEQWGEWYRPWERKK